MIVYIILFIFGVSIGSFLNVVIYRFEKGEGIVFKKSHCVNCGKNITWHDLFPVISFFVLRGKCRYCGQKISWQHPLIEILTGLIFVAIYFLWQKGVGMTAQSWISVFEIKSNCKAVFDFGCYLIYANLIYFFVVFSALWTIFIYDLKHYIIPNRIIYPLIALALAFNIFSSYFSFLSGVDFSLSLVYAILVGAGLFFFMILISKGEWMGMGDVKLAFFMALILSWPNILIALFSAFWLGTLVSLPLLVMKKRGLKSQIPFGPFLIIGTVIAFFWGERIVRWYISISA